MSKLYRKSLLEKIQSPDQLDKMVKITPPSFWVAIIGGLIIIGVVFVWSLVGTIPEKVNTNGVYLHDQNAYTISSEVSGIVEDVNVKVGDEVREGELLYSFDSKSLEDELESLKERLEKVQKITLTSTNDEANQDTQNLLSYKAQYISGANNSQTAGYRVALKKYEDAKEKADEAKTKAEDAYKAYAAAMSNIDSSSDIQYKQQLTQQESLITALEAERDYYQNCVDLWNIYYTLANVTTDWNLTNKKSDTISSYNAATTLATATGRTIKNCHEELKDTVTDKSKVERITDYDGGRPAYTYVITVVTSDTTYNITIDDGQEPITMDCPASKIIYVKDLMDDLTNNGTGIVVAKCVITGDTSKTLIFRDSDYATYCLPFTNGTTAINASYTLKFYGTEASYDRFSVNYVLNKAKQDYQIILATMAQDPNYSENNQVASLKSAYDSATSDYQSKAQIVASAESSLAQYEASDASGESGAIAQAKAYSTQFIAAKGSLVDQLEKEIEKYEKMIDQNNVTASMDGIVTNLAVNKGTAVSQGTATVVIRQKKEAEQVVLYVSLSDGKKLEEGMKVNVYPTTLNRNEYGHMNGTISHVAEYITTSQEIFNKVGDQSLASMFTSNGSVLEVVCELEEDDTSTNGYAWSSEKGKTVSLKESTIVQAEVITDEQHPISILIPFLKDKLENLTKEDSK